MTNFGELQPKHIAEAGQLLPTTFPKELHPYIAYCQPGIVEYLGDALANNTIDNRTRLVATDSSDHLVGFAEFRKPAINTHFLSYLVVAQGSQGLGVGGRMVDTYLAERAASGDRMELDVFDFNVHARGLYRRWGLKEMRHETLWYVRELKENCPHQGACCSAVNESDARARLARYGFGEILLLRAGSATRIGITSRAVMRCYDVGAWRDPCLSTAMVHYFPYVRQALFVTSEPLSGYAPSFRSTRMGGFVDALQLGRPHGE